MKLLAAIRFRLAWWLWFLLGPSYQLGDSLLGSGDQRKANQHILLARWLDREPKP